MDTELEKRKCPHCGEVVDVTEQICPACEWKLNWTDSADNKYVDYLQSFLSNRLVGFAFLLAVVGQLLMLSTCDFFNGLLPYRGELLLWGHVLKAVGETTLLCCVMHGLKYEQHQLAIHMVLTIVLLLAYHVATITLLLAQHSMTQHDATSLYDLCATLLITGEATAAALGFRMTFFFNGHLSITGIVMTVAMLVHLGLNLLLHMSGHDIYADSLVAALLIAYFWMVNRMLLDHNTYTKIIRYGLIEEPA